MNAFQILSDVAACTKGGALDTRRRSFQAG